MQTLPQTPESSVHGHRLWLPSLIASLAFVAVSVVRLQPDLERNFKGLMTALIVLVALALGLIWFLFLSRVRWRYRLATLAVLLVLAFGAEKTLRVNGTVDGTGMPRLAWKWTVARTLPLASQTAKVALAPSASVELPGASSLPDVPQFFGAHRNGIAASDIRLSPNWATTPPKELWRQPVGAAWSAFAVVGGRAYTQEQRGEAEAVTCYEFLTGRLLWSHSNSVHFQQWQGGDGPRATPAVQGTRVFAIGATGILDCLDTTTGKLVWTRNVLEENHLDNLIWGVSGSPLVFDDCVIVTGGLTKGPNLFAYKASDGTPLWKSGDDKSSYASPVLATIAGRRVVLSVNAASLTASDPTTGELLLNYSWSDDKWPKASQPLVLDGDRVFLSSGYGAGCTLLQIKTGADGKLEATQLWKNLRMKTQFNSVAAKDGYIYGLDDGMLACVDIATGERKWKGGRYGAGQTLLAGNLIVIQNESGTVALAEAQPNGFKELGSFPALHAKTWNHPTLVGRYLMVRNSEEMACYELPVEAARAVAASR